MAEEHRHLTVSDLGDCWPVSTPKFLLNDPSASAVPKAPSVNPWWGLTPAYSALPPSGL